MKKRSWPKPSLELIDLLDRHMSKFESERKTMFGCPCYLLNGNIFTGVFSDVVFARFSPRDREILDKRGLGAEFQPVKGRRMKEYRTLSKRILDTPGELDRWLESSYSYVSSLESKKTK